MGRVRTWHAAVRVLGAVWLVAWAARPAVGSRWSEEDFQRKTALLRPYVAVFDSSFDRAATVIGKREYYRVQAGDTLLDIARFHDVGYNEIELANPGVDPWVPPEGQVILVPTEWVLPETDLERGVVVNIPEMRLYYLHPRPQSGPQLVSTYPVGLGRDDWRTPQGSFRIRGKTKNPTWVLPESIRQEWIREKGRDVRMIPGGDPENPLGRYRLELTLPSYAIHGTNMPWGVGMQVSHGCIRLYPEDIEHLFPIVEVGTPGEFVYQPVKVGVRNGRVFVEVHPDIYTLTPGLYREARRILEQRGWWSRIDPERLQRAVVDQTGVPLDVTRGTDAEEVEEDLTAASFDWSPSMPLFR